MSQSVTALDLVNDLLRLHRMETVTTFENPESGASEMLLLVNMAIDSVLNSQDWEFAIQHDGLLMTQGNFTGTADLNLITGTSAFTLVDFSGTASDVVDTGVVRIIATDDTSFGNTAFRVVSFSDAGPPTLSGTLERGWPGAISSFDYEFFVAEYALPSTVRKVISCQHQEESVDVAVLRPSARLEEVIPRPWDTIGDDPEFIAVGGEVVRTYTTGEGEPDPGLRAIIYPVPQSRYALNYSYYKRFSWLSATTDALDITTEARARLVRTAYADSNLTAIGNDSRLGAALKQDERFELRLAKKAAEGADSHRATIRPFGERGAVRRRFREPITDPFA